MVPSNRFKFDAYRTKHRYVSLDLDYHRTKSLKNWPKLCPLNYPSDENQRGGWRSWPSRCENFYWWLDQASSCVVSSDVWQGGLWDLRQDESWRKKDDSIKNMPQKCFTKPRLQHKRGFLASRPFHLLRSFSRKIPCQRIASKINSKQLPLFSIINYFLMGPSCRDIGKGDQKELFGWKLRC